MKTELSARRTMSAQQLRDGVGPMTDLTQPSFDYGELCSEDQRFVKNTTYEIHRLWTQTTENVIAIGKHLTEVKDRLTHGQFGRWLAAEFKWSDRHARNFMSVFEWAGNRKSISDLAIQLEPTAVYQLAAPSTPEPARQEVLAKVEAGERPTTKQVKTMIAKHKPTRRSAKPKPIDGDREPTPPKAAKLDPIVAMRQLESALRESKVTPSDWAAEQPAFRRRVLLSEIDALRSALTRLADALRQQLRLDQPAPTLSPPEGTPEELCEELADEQVGNGAEPRRLKTYTCMVVGCGTFEGPVQRGQPPKFCPTHRTSSAARKKAKEAILQRVAEAVL